MIPYFIQIRELADLMFLSERTVKRRVRKMKKDLNISAWEKIRTEQAITYFGLDRYKIEEYFCRYRIVN